MLRTEDQDEFRQMTARDDIRRFKNSLNRLTACLPYAVIVLACVLYALAFSWLLE